MKLWKDSGKKRMSVMLVISAVMVMLAAGLVSDIE